MGDYLREGLRLHYAVRGRGPPLILFNHSGASALGWHEAFLNALALDHTLILPDHRGTGQSQDGTAPYGLAVLALDGLAALDDVAIEVADVMGLSMGGAVAQELALAAPKRVRRLVLAATFCGPRMSVPALPWVAELLTPRPGLSRREQLRRMLPIYYSRAAIAEDADALIDLTERGTGDTPLATLPRQGSAVRAFDTHERLRELRVPTLVLHGDEDAIIPVENAGILQARLPDARAHILPGVGHVVTTERPSQVASAVRDFLNG